MQMESLDEMEQWAAANGGVEAVRAGLAPGGQFNLENKRLASAWLQRKNEEAEARKQFERLSLETRGVIANEIAAAEAKRAADAAVDSAKSARLAVWISARCSARRSVAGIRPPETRRSIDRPVT